MTVHWSDDHKTVCPESTQSKSLRKLTSTMDFVGPDGFCSRDIRVSGVLVV